MNLTDVCIGVGGGMAGEGRGLFRRSVNERPARKEQLLHIGNRMILRHGSVCF